MSRTCGPVAETIRLVLLADQQFVEFLGGQRVYSEEQLPGIEAYDFVAIASADSRAFGRFGQPGEQIGIALHLWSKIVPGAPGFAPAKKRIYAMGAYVARAVNDKTIPVLGFGAVLSGRADLTAILQDPLGPYVHGVMRYEAFVSYDKTAPIVA